MEEHAIIGSTNDRILELAAADAPEGAVVLARAQSAGRGRLGRQWRSGAGKGLYLSVLLRPRLPAGALGLLSLAAGAAVRRALAGACGLAGRIKWPNDVLVGGRKIAGVLIEGRSGSDGRHALAVGIGINTDWEPADREGEFRVPPTAVSLETDPRPR
jgi:BirA family biotin operon repressor/biotin-[acetyl-CoA-carboxylase] ligase